MNPDRTIFARSSPLMHEERKKNREEIGGDMAISKAEKYLSSSVQDALQVSDSNLDDNENSMTIDAALLLTSLASNNSKLLFAKTNTDQSHEELRPFSRVYSILEPDHQYKSEQEIQDEHNVKNKKMKKEDETTSNTKLLNDDNGRIRAVSLDNPGPVLAFPPYESLKDYMNNHPTPNLSYKKQNSGLQFTIGTTAISPPHSPRLLSVSSKKVEIRQDNKTDIKPWAHCPSKQVQSCKRNRRKAVLDPRKRFCLRKKQQQQEQKSTKTEQKLNQDDSLNISNMLQRNKTRSHMESKNITYISNRHHLQQPRLVNALATSNHMKKTILRRKFSWKNYPEVSLFFFSKFQKLSFFEKFEIIHIQILICLMKFSRVFAF